MKPYSAHGKLLLSAEYLVMYGAEALALPLKKGQRMEITSSGSGFHWSAMENGRQWFSAEFRPGDLHILKSTDPGMALALKKMLEACLELNPAFNRELNATRATTHLEFPAAYGWGSSSTLTSLLASWTGVDPMELHFRISEGSGYDVACARAGGPILYQIRDGSPRYEEVAFRPPFRDRLWFVWLGQKQPTAAHLASLRNGEPPPDTMIVRFSDHTRDMLGAPDLRTFTEVMDAHEDELADWLRTDPLRNKFPGIPGSVKSLGAWGGDFMLLASGEPEGRLRDLLKQKGLHMVYSFEEIVYDGS